MALTAEGHFLEAAEISNLTSNMPEVCSRICPRNGSAKAPAFSTANPNPSPSAPWNVSSTNTPSRMAECDAVPSSPNGFRVAVLGSGPAGWRVPMNSPKLGYTVTVFRSPTAAGRPARQWHPAFKLEKTMVGRRMELLKERGVSFAWECDRPRYESKRMLLTDFDAVFLGFGALQAKPLDVPGASSQWRLPRPAFLHPEKCAGSPGSSRDQRSRPPCRRARRRRYRHGLFAHGHPVRGASKPPACTAATLPTCPAAAKSISPPSKKAPSSVSSPARSRAQGRPGARSCAVHAIAHGTGRSRCHRPPQALPVPGSEFDQPADVVLVAYGFDPVPFPPGSDLGKSANGWGASCRRQSDDQCARVFAGGDLVRGPSLVVHAVRDGRKAAKAIGNYLLTQSPKRPVIVESLPGADNEFTTSR